MVVMDLVVWVVIRPVMTMIHLWMTELIGVLDIQP